jgi:hypothetical protein
MVTSQSPIDTFAQLVGAPTKPEAGRAIREALAGVDVNKLAAFNDAFMHQIHSGSHINSAFISSLRSTNGTDNKANIDFARKMQAVFKAVDASPDVTPPWMSHSQATEASRRLHDGIDSISKAMDHYVASELSPQPQAIPGVQRRHFNKAELTSMEQHIVAGTASRQEIMDVQKELKDSGANLGKFGQNHDGIDGKAGKFTLGAVAKAMKLTPTSP